MFSLKKIKAKAKRLFDTWDWRKYSFSYVARWRDSGNTETPLIDFMNEKKIPYREWNSLFEAYGDEFYEIMKKLTIEEMINPRFDSLTNNEKAMIGTTVFKEFMIQLNLELGELDRDKE